MYWPLRLLLILATAILTVSFLPTLFGRMPFPNPILIGVITSSLLGQPTLALAWAIGGGVILDLFTSGRGFYTLIFVLLALGSSLVRDRLGPHPAGTIGLVMILVASSVLPLVESWQAGTGWSSALLLAILANGLGLAAALAIAYNRRVHA